MTLSKLNQFIIVFIAVSFRLIALFYSSTILNYLLLAILVILTLYNIYQKKYDIVTFRKLIILLILSMLLFFIYNEDNLFIYFIAALSFSKESNEKIIKYFTILSILSFITVIISGQLGIIDVITATRYLEGELVYRNSLGFGHVNAVFIYYIGIIFGIYHLTKSKTKLFLIYIVTTIIAFWIFTNTNCRSGFYLYLLFIVVSLLYNDKINDKVKPIAPYLFTIFTIFSFLLILTFGKSINNPINLLLSNRLYYGYYYLKNNLWLSLTGTGVVGSYVLDNYFLSLLVKTGFVGYFIYSYIFKVGGEKIKGDSHLVLVLLFTLIYGISECNLYGNYIYIILLKNIIDNKKVIANEKN